MIMQVMKNKEICKGGCPQFVRECCGTGPLVGGCNSITIEIGGGAGEAIGIGHGACRVDGGESSDLEGTINSKHIGNLAGRGLCLGNSIMLFVESRLIPWIGQAILTEAAASALVKASGYGRDQQP